MNNRVTLSLGLRYELRPPFEDREENISNFLRDTPNGDVVVPSRVVDRPDRARVRGLDRHLAHPRGRRDRLSEDAAVHRQEQRRAAARHRLASGRRQPDGDSRRLRHLPRADPRPGVQLADRHPHVRQRDVPQHVRRRRRARTRSSGRKTFAGDPVPRRHARRHAELLHRQRSPLQGSDDAAVERDVRARARRAARRCASPTPASAART